MYLGYSLKIHPWITRVGSRFFASHHESRLPQWFGAGVLIRSFTPEDIGSNVWETIGVRNWSGLFFFNTMIVFLPRGTEKVVQYVCGIASVSFVHTKPITIIFSEGYRIKTECGNRLTKQWWQGWSKHFGANTNRVTDILKEWRERKKKNVVV